MISYVKPWQGQELGWGNVSWKCKGDPGPEWHQGGSQLSTEGGLLGGKILPFKLFPTTPPLSLLFKPSLLSGGASTGTWNNRGPKSGCAGWCLAAWFLFPPWDLPSHLLYFKPCTSPLTLPHYNWILTPDLFSGLNPDLFKFGISTQFLSLYFLIFAPLVPKRLQELSLCFQLPQWLFWPLPRSSI